MKHALGELIDDETVEIVVKGIYPWRIHGGITASSSPAWASTRTLKHGSAKSSSTGCLPQTSAVRSAGPRGPRR